MRAVGLALAMFAVAPVIAAEQAQQFDLVCTAKGDAVHYRVDLGRGEWCQDRCTIVRKVVSSTSGMLTLIDSRPDAGNGLLAVTTINRVTGEWLDLFAPGGSSRPPLKRNGSCAAASYTGLPTAKF